VKAISGIKRAARLKLDRLETAVDLKDLTALPGNRSEALRGDRRGQYSIRINDHGGFVSNGSATRPVLCPLAAALRCLSAAVSAAKPIVVGRVALWISAAMIAAPPRTDQPA